MTGIPMILAFLVAIVIMIVAISKFKIHPFLSIMAVSLLLGLVAGILAAILGDFPVIPVPALRRTRHETVICLGLVQGNAVQ